MAGRHRLTGSGRHCRIAKRSLFDKLFVVSSVAALVIAASTSAWLIVTVIEIRNDYLPASLSRPVAVQSSAPQLTAPPRLSEPLPPTTTKTRAKATKAPKTTTTTKRPVTATTATSQTVSN